MESSEDCPRTEVVTSSGNAPPSSVTAGSPGLARGWAAGVTSDSDSQSIADSGASARAGLPIAKPMTSVRRRTVSIGIQGHRNLHFGTVW